MDIIWNPEVIQNLKDSELSLYLEFSCTACIPGGGCNVEKALNVLFNSNGDIKLAMERLLLCRELALNSWNKEEIHDFERLIMEHGKNFSTISNLMKTKSVKECVEFYYLWKKSAPAKHYQEPNDHQLQLQQQQQQQLQQPLVQPQHSQSIEPNPQQQQQQVDLFPCKICGRIFEKIKSRSAHMKRHKNNK